MLRNIPVSAELQRLLKKAKGHQMTKKERDEQRISFAYGNLSLHDSNVTRKDVEKTAKELYAS